METYQCPFCGFGEPHRFSHKVEKVAKGTVANNLFCGWLECFNCGAKGPLEWANDVEELLLKVICAWNKRIKPGINIERLGMVTLNYRERLIAAGVTNLKTFGYENVNAKNILTDKIYSKFFLSMLNDNLGTDSKIDKVIKELIKEIEGGEEDGNEK